ncbi:MAG TPA: kelch repeat-containing protein [Myxococcaceae bacterium]|nr:kelch repeat-containing protein [Myxococcaceae bacterium]
MACRDCFEAMPQGRSWTEATRLPTPRSSAAISVGPDGRIYLAAGRGVGHVYRTELERFDVETGSWASLAPLPTSRMAPGAEWVDGILYVFGGAAGDGQSRALGHAYVPSVNAWVAMSPMLRGRSFPVTGVVGSRIYALGGQVDGGGLTPTAEYFETTTGTWHWAQSGAPTSEMNAGVVLGSKIYVFGRPATRIYDAEIDSWSDASAVPESMNMRSAVTMDGLIYLIGGQTHTGNASRRVDVYAPHCDAWTTAPSLAVGRRGPNAAVIDGHIYTFGGYTGSTYPDLVEVF